jgi:hypothetical protein
MATAGARCFVAREKISDDTEPASGDPSLAIQPDAVN